MNAKTKSGIRLQLSSPMSKNKKEFYLLLILWLAHITSIVYLYWPLIPKICDIFHSSLSFGQIISTMSQAKYYYLYLSIPINVLLFLRIHKLHEFKVMKLRLWMKRHLIGLGWFLGIISMTVAFICTIEN